MASHCRQLAIWHNGGSSLVVVMVKYEYIPVEECGVYSKETGFVPDIDKIEQLNKKLHLGVESTM